MVLLDLVIPLSGLGALVAPGWLPLALVIFIGGVVALLYVNMRSHLRKINAPVDESRPVASPFADDDE